jgi:hypothetical protein
MTSKAMAMVLAGVLAAAGAGAGLAPSIELLELLVGDLARGVSADGLEDVLDRDVAPVEAAGRIEPP